MKRDVRNKSRNIVEFHGVQFMPGAIHEIDAKKSEILAFGSLEILKKKKKSEEKAEPREMKLEKSELGE